MGDFDEATEDQGLLSTSAILQWGEIRERLPVGHPRRRFIEDSKVKEFLEWLGDEEGEDEEESEEEEES